MRFYEQSGDIGVAGASAQDQITELNPKTRKQKLSAEYYVYNKNNMLCSRYSNHKLHVAPWLSLGVCNAYNGVLVA